MKLSECDWQVPPHRVERFTTVKSCYCVCVFVINEGERLHRQLERMQPFHKDVDVIVADGGSSDGSVDSTVLRRLGVRALLVKEGSGGLSAQMRMAMSFAMQEGYQGVICMDGNNKDDPASIPMFCESLDQGWDHIQGSRFVPGGKAINTPFFRHAAIKLIHRPLIAYASGYRYTDTTNGFRAYSRQFLMDSRVAPFRNVFQRYELHYYLAIRAPRLGFRTTEVPVTRAYPEKGRIPTKISFVKGNVLVMTTLILSCLGWFNPATTSE